ncbi:MAG: MBL fold metallo-hydrolase [Burkholderiaceae bacterium]|nr:MBL fold metallo-hydrolase [Burkholderiaceae bacterium]
MGAMRAFAVRLLRNLFWGLTVFSVGVVCAHAGEVPAMVRKQVPAYYRILLGQFEITALLDGVMEVDKAVLTNEEPERLQRILAERYVDASRIQVAVNVYLVHTGSRLVLVDAGCGGLFGKKMGQVVSNMRAAGYLPEQVDTVLLTHMHGDHLGGLVTKAGKKVFPNATVYVDQQESDFWLSTENEKKAPAYLERNFRAARTVSGPYRASGKWKTFRQESEIVPGIHAVAAPGHTPGHTLFKVVSGGQELYILGDLVHSHSVQFAYPDVAVAYDSDQKQAVITRRKIFGLAAQSGWFVAGMHLPYPGVGRIRSNGDDSYTWIPSPFTPLP